MINPTLKREIYISKKLFKFFLQSDAHLHLFRFCVQTLLGKHWVHLHLQGLISKFQRHILHDLLPIKDFPASATSSGTKGQQLFRLGTQADLTERWRAGSREQAQSQSSVPSLYGLTANGRLTEKQSKKKKKQSFHKDSKQLLLYDHIMSGSLIYTAAKASTVPKLRSSWLHSYGPCSHSINTHRL